MGYRSRWSRLAGVTWVILAGCQGGEGPAGAEDHLPAVWTLRASPAVHIGDEASSAGVFERVSGVFLASSGRIYVVDAGAAQIRVFDADGGPLHTWGGQGDGPGEYRAPRLLGAIRGDTLAVVDSRDQVIDFLSPDGIVAHSHRLLGGEVPTPSQALAVMADGRIVYQLVQLFGGTLREGGVLTDTIRLSVTGRDGVAGSPLGSAVAPQWVWTKDEQVPMPFSPQFSVSVRGDSVFTLDASGTHVLLLRPGEPPETWRAPRAPASVTRADRDAYRRWVDGRGLSEPFGDLWKDALDHSDLPRSKPVYDKVLATDDGEVWARVMANPGPAQLWDVYSAAGTARGVVEIPAEVTPHQVTANRVVGVVRDSMGVQTVAIFEKAAVADTARTRSALTQLREELESLAELQEIHFADHYTYTEHLEALHRVPPVVHPDVVIVVTAAGREGWSASATHPSLGPGQACTIVHGRPPVMPDPLTAAGEGVVSCSVDLP